MHYYSANGNYMDVQNVTGVFVANTIVRGVTSNAAYILLTSPTITPEQHSPETDNNQLLDEVDDILLDRGSNPTRS